jgi:hypothetical protein
MKFNITLPILAFIVLIIVVYFAFSRENAKILTNKNDEFVFIDSDILLQRMRTNLNELKRILRRDMNKKESRICAENSETGRLRRGHRPQSLVLRQGGQQGVAV